MRLVTKDEFFKTIADEKLDVHPRIINSHYPYTQVWHFPRQPNRAPYGRSVGLPDGGFDYFVAER